MVKCVDSQNTWIPLLTSPGHECQHQFESDTIWHSVFRISDALCWETISYPLNPCNWKIEKDVPHNNINSVIVSKKKPFCWPSLCLGNNIFGQKACKGEAGVKNKRKYYIVYSMF